MQRKLASLQTIKELAPIDGADLIEKATVLGWQLVVKKGEFQIGDPCIFVEPDAFLPIRKEFEFLRKGCFKTLADGREGFRLRTVRLRGMISQGLALPLSLFNETKDIVFEEGLDITNLLSIVKYEPPIPAHLAGEVKGTRPHFVPVTDEPRVQTDFVIPMMNSFIGEQCYVTQKIDGSSISIHLRDGEFGVCSRNLELRETAGNSQWKLARLMDIENKLRSVGRNIVLQGEIFGEGIQGNPEKLIGQRINFFNVFDADAHRYMDFADMRKFLSDLDLPMVPVLDECLTMHNDMERWVEMSKFRSTINPDSWAEGIVIRPLVEKRFNGERFSFKVINPIFLLEQEE